ncbi:MAG: glycosyltransferase [Dysgonomonas sp.]|nr:glycosyltransferase [Dysgonomonas sp.]
MIPNTIHLIFLREDEEFPKLFTDCMQRIKDMHPDWNIKLYNERDAQKILKEHLPQYVDTYNSFKYNVQKADFLRIALIYIYGGFYMDLDMWSLKSLNELRSNSLVVGEEKTVCLKEQKALNLKNRLRIANYMFGGIAGHPFWLLLMQHMSSLSKEPINTAQELLDITGPGLLTDLYHDNIDLYPDIFLLKNNDRKCLQPYHNEVSCHFGEYAAHLHTGTWRNEI